MEKIIGKYKIEVIQDSEPESPREWDNLGNMICFHRNYNLGDKHQWENKVEYCKFLHTYRDKLIV